MVAAQSTGIKAGAKATSSGGPARKKSSNTPLAHGVGRRKRSVARVWLRSGGGNLVINGRKYEEYFPSEVYRFNINLALKACPFSSRYDVTVNVYGGGISSQSDAIKLGVARAYLEIDSEVRALFKPYKLLTVDSRTTERKKYGQRGARRKFQFVKR